jgi:hypothetical protein
MHFSVYVVEIYSLSDSVCMYRFVLRKKIYGKNRAVISMELQRVKWAARTHACPMVHETCIQILAYNSNSHPDDGIIKCL